MPYRDIFGALHFVTVIDVEQFARVEITGGPPNPGPQAA
jgi:hypothetical protein